MKNMYLMTTAVIALSTAASLASAQSLSSGDELWTGGFIGIGGSFLDVSGDLYFDGNTYGEADWFDDTDFYNTGGPTEGVGPALGSGAFGTVEIGADKQVNQLVFGGFASYDFGSADATATTEDSWYSEGCEGICGPMPASITATISVGDNWAIGGRAGYLAGPNTLIYGLAAMSSARMSVSIDSTLEGFFPDDSDLIVGGGSPIMDVSGSTFGAGIEHMFNNNWSMKLEYRNTVYDGSVLTGGDNNSFEGSYFEPADEYDGTTEGFADVMDITTQAIRASINYRF